MNSINSWMYALIIYFGFLIHFNYLFCILNRSRVNGYMALVDYGGTGGRQINHLPLHQKKWKGKGGRKWWGSSRSVRKLGGWRKRQSKIQIEGRCWFWKMKFLSRMLKWSDYLVLPSVITGRKSRKKEMQGLLGHLFWKRGNSLNF